MAECAKAHTWHVAVVAVTYTYTHIHTHTNECVRGCRKRESWWGSYHVLLLMGRLHSSNLQALSIVVCRPNAHQDPQGTAAVLYPAARPRETRALKIDSSRLVSSRVRPQRQQAGTHPLTPLVCTPLAIQCVRCKNYHVSLLVVCHTKSPHAQQRRLTGTANTHTVESSCLCLVGAAERSACPAGVAEGVVDPLCR